MKPSLPRRLLDAVCCVATVSFLAFMLVMTVDAILLEQETRYDWNPEKETDMSYLYAGAGTPEADELKRDIEESCRCNFHQYMVGDGCAICNPELPIENTEPEKAVPEIHGKPF